jgi:hypothetical protein
VIAPLHTQDRLPSELLLRQLPGVVRKL